MGTRKRALGHESRRWMEVGSGTGIKESAGGVSIVDEERGGMKRCTRAEMRDVRRARVATLDQCGATHAYTKVIQ